MEVKLGLIQMKVTPNKEANLNYAVNAIEVVVIPCPMLFTGET